MAIEGPISRDSFLQRRLARFGWWGAVVLLVGLLMRGALALIFADPPRVLDAVGQSVATLALFAMWAVVRRATALSRLHLALVDISAMNLVAVGFAGMSAHLPLVAHPTLVLLLALTFTFTLRATYVPSSVRQTVIVHATAYVWLLLAAWYTAHRAAAVDPASADASVRGQLITATVWWVFNSGAAVAATSVIYGLREEVREATQLGQYTLERKLGEGAMGAVYSARHAMLRRPTAVKLLPPSKRDDRAVARFEREVQRTAELSHPNIVTVFDYGRTPDGIFYYAMEHLDGLDLSDLVGRHGPLAPERAVHILVQICEGLAAAHETGLIHRDIKPGNVLCLRRGQSADRIKLVDFGLVKEVERGEDEGALVGTPAFMAPEAIESPDAVDERSDLYGVGALAYFLLAGRPVFEGESVIEVLGKHLYDEPPGIGRDDLPEGLEALVLRCLSKNPEARPASAAELARLLRQIPGVAPWTLEDAHAWWADVPAEPSPSADDPGELPTFSVDLERRG